MSSEITYERVKENLAALNMKNTLEIIDNYLERAIADKINIVDVLDHILSTQAHAKKDREELATMRFVENKENIILHQL